MKNPEDRTAWFFVDESGDPAFLGRHGRNLVGQPGCSPVLLLGFVELHDPRPARLALAELRKKLISDPYLKPIPSLAKTAVAFHAKDDCPEVRKAVFELLADLEFEAQFVVARKDVDTFRSKFKCSQNKFYDHLVTLLFKNVLHRAARNAIYFAQRGEKSRQVPLETAIIRGADRFRRRWNSDVVTEVTVQCQRPSGEPCLQIIDYMIWAVQRAFVRREMRYFDYVRSKIALVVDLYDIEHYPQNWYDRKRNPFDVQKISPL